MNRRHEDSDLIASAGYDEPSETMEIEFTNRTIYQYFDVPPPVYEAFETSDSKGKFFRAHLLDRYRYSRVA
jgi:hypothetical protein